MNVVLVVGIILKSKKLLFLVKVRKGRASDFFQDWWAEVTHGAKMGGHFLK